MSDHGLGILIPAEKIQQRVVQLAAQIDSDYPEGVLLLVGVLKGAFIFLSDLARAIRRPVRFDFIGASSYGEGTVSTGKVRLTKDLTTDVTEAHVLVVEDIIDTGITLDYLLGELQKRNPRSLRVVTLLDKPERHERNVLIDYTGFVIPNEFVVGYGMDYAEEYRDLPDICVVTA